MKKRVFKIIFTIFAFLISATQIQAVQFDVLVLPTDLFSVCDNYFCFPEVSEIISEDVINNLNSYKNINAIELSTVRAKMEQDSELKITTSNMLKQFANNDKIDFTALKTISNKFGVKSVAIISSSVISDQSEQRRNLWEILEISGAFNISYPFTMLSNAVLTDTVNNIVMWSGKYKKNISDSNGYFSATTLIQAGSHLEKIKQYSKTNIAQNISQNIRLRFFPQDVRTFEIKKTNNGEEQEQPKFVPNALEHLIKPQMIKEIEEGHSNSSNPMDDFIFEF